MTDLEQAAADLRAAIPVAQLRRIAWPHEGPVPVGNQPTPALVDGLDREVCLARWMENRLAIEGKGWSISSKPPNSLTPAQIACGRALWLERYGALRGDALRARVAADAQAERNRVTYCEVDPCD